MRMRVLPMLMTMGMTVAMHLGGIGCRHDELAMQYALGAEQRVGN